MGDTINRRWVLTGRPKGEKWEEVLNLEEQKIGALNDGEVLVRLVYLSLDPTNRIWMSDIDQYMPPVNVGEVMRGGGVGIVEASKNEKFNEGDVVQAFSGWQTHYVSKGKDLNKLPQGVPLTAFLGVFGAIGATAYFGLLDVGQPKSGDTVVVSAAAGAVGSIVGQIAKIKGCTVVGIAGSDDKCKWITQELGFDHAINYKKEDVGAKLDEYCPDGIDVDFENVGGRIFDEILKRMKQGGRVSLCGMISVYNDFNSADGDIVGPAQFPQILMKRLTVQGFIVTDFLPRFPEAMKDLGEWLAEGKIKYSTDIVDGIENMPGALHRLFEGENTGKLMVRVSEDPTTG